MIHASRSAAEDAIRECMPYTDRHRREIDAVGHIAHRIYVPYRGSRGAVDGDAAILRVELDPGRLEAQSVHVRMTADGEEHLIGRDGRPVREVRGIGVAMLVHLRHDALGQYPDPRALHLAAHVRAHILVGPPQDIFTAVDDRHA